MHKDKFLTSIKSTAMLYNLLCFWMSLLMGQVLYTPIPAPEPTAYHPNFFSIHLQKKQEQKMALTEDQQVALEELRSEKEAIDAELSDMGLDETNMPEDLAEVYQELADLITTYEEHEEDIEETKEDENKPKGEDQEDHIPKGKFCKIVRQEIDTMMQAGDPLDLLSTEDDYLIEDTHKIDGARIADRVASIRFKTPLAQTLAKELIIQFKGAKIIDDIIEIVGSLLDKYDNKHISEHYNINREAYGKDTGEDEFIELFERHLINDFTKLRNLKSFIAQDAIIDPNFAPNKEKAANESEKEQEKAEAKAAADYKTFLETVRTGRDKAISELSQMATDGKVRENMQVLELMQLESNSTSSISCLPYMEPYRDRLVFQLIDSMRRSNSLLTLGQAKEIMMKELFNDAQVIDWKEVYELYKEQDESSSIYPAGFAGWINNSTTVVSSSGFETAITNWTQNIRGSIGKRWAELDANKKAYNIKPKAFDKELKSLFSKALHPIGSDLGGALYLHIQKGFKPILGEEKVSMKKLDQAWLAGLDAANKDAIVQDLFSKNILTKVKSEAEITTCVANMNSYFPIDSMIWQAMDNARHYTKALAKPAMELAKDKATCTFYLAATSKRTQSMELGFEVDLRFIPATTATGLNMYVPVPQASGKLVNINTNSYEVSLESVWVGTSTKTTTGGIPLSVSTPITWKLNVRDTSEETVIQEAKKRAMKLLSANIGDIIPAAKLKQVSGITDKILGGEVRLVGDEHGNIANIEVETTLLGLPFVIGVGKDGFVAKLKNPLKPRELRQFSYGESQFTLYLTATAWADVAGGQCTLKISSGKLGTADGKYADKPVQVEDLEEGKKAYAIPHLTQKKD